LTLAPGNPNCENEGSYPGVNVNNGDLYAAYEFNWATNVFIAACFNTQTQDVMVRVPFSCLVLKTTSPCSGPSNRASEPVTSLDAAFIPGYNRFPANDFPRVAVDPAFGTVSMVWNDARLHPLGDILLQSFGLGSLAPVQSAPVVLNSDSGGLHFLPALRNVSATGKLVVSWYDRTSPDTAVTSVQSAFGINPRLVSTPPNRSVTSVASDWDNTSSDIVPNFGDYTDNYIAGGRVFAAWSDNRIGEPQPFEANAPVP
jgi:hypothetical protein